LPKLKEGLVVLFVDDDRVLRKLFSRSLKRVAPTWTVQEAGSGETALLMIEHNDYDYDIIFIDNYMASVQKQLLGTEVTRALRSKGFKGIICGLSANNMEDAFKSAGAKAFMSKPFSCEKNQLTIELHKLISSADDIPVPYV
jgi:CheY-like chemotaxis protein